MKQKNFKLTLLIFCTLFGVLSCNKEEETNDPREQFVVLDRPVAQLEIGGEITISATFGDGVTPSRTYEWSVDNEDVVQVSSPTSSSLSLVALQAGVAIVKYGSTDGQIYATCRVTVRGEDEDASGLIDAPVFIGFGSSEAVEGWNAFIGANNYGAGTMIADLIDAEGASTGVSITIVEPFNARNGNGPSDSNTPFNMPSPVSLYSYYGNSGAAFNGKVIEQSTLTLVGLDPLKELDFCFFGSRTGVSDNRETDYIVKGVEEKTASLNTSNNTSSIACVQKIRPTENGVVTIVVTAGPNNNNGNRFFYLTSMRISLSED